MQNQIKREIAFDTQLKTALEQQHFVIFREPRGPVEEFPIAETTRRLVRMRGRLGRRMEIAPMNKCISRQSVVSEILF